VKFIWNANKWNIFSRHDATRRDKMEKLSNVDINCRWKQENSIKNKNRKLFFKENETCLQLPQLQFGLSRGKTEFYFANVIKMNMIITEQFTCLHMFRQFLHCVPLGCYFCEIIFLAKVCTKKIVFDILFNFDLWCKRKDRKEMKVQFR